MNAIALKELRQIVRSKLIVVVLHFFLVAQILTILIAVSTSFISSDFTMNTNVGNNVSTGLTIVSSIFFFGFIPFYTFVKGWGERSSRNMDLYFLTAITPWSIVRGKIIAYGALTVLFVCMTMGMTAVVFLLRGFDLFEFSKTILLFFSVAILLNGIALYCAFAFRNRFQRLLNMMLFSAAVYFLALRLFYLITFAGGPFEYIVYAILVVVFIMTYIITSVRIMPETANRALPVRIALTIIIIGAYAWGSLSMKSLREFSELWLYVVTGISLLSLFLASKDNEIISCRIRKAIPRFPLFRIVLPFYSGPLYGFLWSFLIMGIVYAGLEINGQFAVLRNEFHTALLYCLYLLAYILIARFLYSLLSGRKMNNNKIWLFALLLIVIVSLTPIVCKLVPLILTGAAVKSFTSPEQLTKWMPGNLILLWYKPNITLNYTIACSALLCGLLLNARWVWRQITLSSPLPKIKNKTVQISQEDS